MLVKFGRSHINPAQVIRVAEYTDPDMETYVIIHLVDRNDEMVRNKSVDDVVAIINANL